MATLKRTMFREYDIRGRENEEELNEKSIYLIARGFGKMLRDAGVGEAILGHDARGTSESFHAQARTALLESGINIIDIGTVTTPMSYWAQFCFKTKGLCMITASHNPAGWNGLKLGTGLSQTLGPEEIKTLYAIIERESWSEGKGTVRTEDIKDRYVQDLINRAKFAKKLKVLVNTGNGTSGLFAPELFRSAGIEVVEHFTEVDPTYPNYTANPDGEKMMQDTGAQTVKNRCDIGFAFDGDGDRLGVVDEKGTIVWPDRYMMLLSRLILSKNPEAKIVFDVKVSEALPEDIKAHGGNPVMWKTGHSYIKAKLMEENAALAGEMSGHIFFADDYYGFDDAFFAGLKVLEYVASQGKPVSELIADTPYYVSTPTIQVKTTDEEKYQIVESLVQEFRAEGHKMVDVSGARVYMEDGWGLVRASSNTPTLVLRFEAKTEAGLEKIKAVFREKLAKFPSVDSNWDSSGH
jgi:phosphomannomutase/phosphoglucomutase